MSSMETLESACPEDLAGQVDALLLPSHRLITIDGHSGVGKSRLSRSLKDVTGATLLEIDDFLDPDKPGKYLNKVKRLDLLSALNRALTTGRVIVDGLCIDHILRDVDGGARFRVYVQAVPSAYSSRSAEARRRAQFGTELYHRLYKPEQRADSLILVPHADLTQQREAILASPEY